MIRYSNILLAVLFTFGCVGCTGRGDGQSSSAGDTLTRESRLLTMVDCGDYIVADVANPWADGLLGRYILADRNYSGQLPEGTVVRVPLERSIVCSGVHGGAIDELGAIDRIAGVAEGKYFRSADIRRRVDSGEIVDIGNPSSPSVEAAVGLEPDAILLSPYQNQSAGALGELGVAVLQMADYMEPTPLGRAEWIRLIGRLYGRGEQADSIYNGVVAEYESLRRQASAAASRPVVITEMPQPGGVWYIPSGESYMARMLADAGGSYPWASEKGSGSLNMDAAAMLERGGDADVWLIRNYGELSRVALARSNPLVEHFRPFREGTVYVCDTSVSPLFDEFPFHPERLLADYIAIFHPELSGSHALRYFAPAK